MRGALRLCLFYYLWLSRSNLRARKAFRKETSPPVNKEVLSLGMITEKSKNAKKELLRICSLSIVGQLYVKQTSRLSGFLQLPVFVVQAVKENQIEVAYDP